MVERKYIVLSISDVEKFLKDEEKSALSNICERLEAGRNSDQKPPLDGVFIDKSWGDVYEGSKNLLTEALHNIVKPLELTNVSDNRYDLCKGTLVYHKGYNPHSGRQPGDVYRIEQVSDRGICVVYESGNKPNSGYRTDFFTKRGFDETWSFTNPLFEGVKVGVQIGPTHSFSCRKPGEVYEITTVNEGSVTYKYVGGGDKPPTRLIGFVGRSWFFERWKIL